MISYFKHSQLPYYWSDSFQTFAILFLLFFCFHTNQLITRVRLPFNVINVSYESKLLLQEMQGIIFIQLIVFLIKVYFQCFFLGCTMYQVHVKIVDLPCCMQRKLPLTFLFPLAAEEVESLLLWSQCSADNPVLQDNTSSRL